MPNLSTILDTPINWLDWDTDKDLLAFLSDLQANILKGHGRDHTANVFLSFSGMSTQSIKALLQKLSFLTTSALDQLRSAEAFRLTGVSGGRIICTFLSKGAYEKLGAPDDQTPSSPAFRTGMRGRGQLETIQFNGFTFQGMKDPESKVWDTVGTWAPDKEVPDAMVLIASDSEDDVTAAVQTLHASILDTSGAKEVGVDRGTAQRRKQQGGTEKGEGIEHFGYVDGVSQPLFLAEDIEKLVAKGAIDKWDPTCPPSQFIIPDPARCTDVSAGSYLVYRRLEQNVKEFKEQEDMLKGKFQSPPIDERAGALVVGRFEDGTPVAVSSDPLGGDPINNFTYEDAPSRAPGCPFRAHIRKTNPRTIDPATGKPDRGDIGRLMARRGITYGKRQDREPGSDFPENDRPTGGVGLLFMAYMADLTEQFEFTQTVWAGNADFPPPGNVVGMDPIIGQRLNSLPTHGDWQDRETGQSGHHDFKANVRLVGGEYFFAPAISFLQRG